MNILQRIFKPAKEPEKREMSTASRDGWEPILSPATTSGAQVTPLTSLGVPAALRAVNLLSGAVASLPLKVYRRAGEGREPAAGHQVNALLHRQPNPRLTPFIFKELIMNNLLLHGNFYAYIDYASNGQPVALWPIEPQRVVIDVDTGTGNITYKVRTIKGEQVFSPASILHIVGLTLDGIRGISPISLARESLGGAISELKHGHSFFKRGASISGVLQHPGKLGEEAGRNLRESWQDKYSGTDNAAKVAILEEGMTFNPVSLSNKDSQWLESRQVSVLDIARIFGLPPALLGHLEKASYSSQEAQNIEFLTHSLRPWLTRIEQACNRDLLFNDSAYYTEFTTGDLLRTDLKTRYEAHRIGISSGFLTVNEVRRMENLEPVPGGDEPMAQLNMGPLEQVNQTEEPRQQPVTIETREIRAPISHDERRLLIKEVLQDLLEDEQEDILALAEETTDPAILADKLESYFNEQPATVRAAMLPVFTLLIREAHRVAAKLSKPMTPEELKEFISTYTDKFASKHAGINSNQARDAIRGTEDVKTALTGHYVKQATMPGKVAQLESTALNNQTRLETYRKAGVTKLVWRAEGTACNFCQKLDGKVVGLGEPFVKEGEQIPGAGGTMNPDRPLTARAPRITPPIHLGCCCQIEPSN